MNEGKKLLKTNVTVLCLLDCTPVALSDADDNGDVQDEG